MIETFYNNVMESVPILLNFFQPILQYMFTNPILGIPFIMFVITGFSSVLLHIKNILKEGLKA